MSHYISKDFIHTGTGLRLDPEEAWPLLSRACRKAVRAAKRHGLRFEPAAGTPEDLLDLRSIWYDPSDPNLPDTLPEGAHLFRTVGPDGTLLGMALLLPVGNHLFLNNLAATVDGKALRASDFTLWSCVEHFADSSYAYIDVGVSYRANLQRFFRRFATISYPVVFHRPELYEPVRALPFFHRRPRKGRVGTPYRAHLAERFGTFTFVPDVSQGRAVLERLGHEPHDLTPGGTGIGIIDLRRIFPVQFGAVLTGLDIDDRALWNEHGCLDTFKRELVWAQIDAYPLDLGAIDAERQRVHALYTERFALDDLAMKPPAAGLVEHFEMSTSIHERLHQRYEHFEVDHGYSPESGWLRLPVHQELDESHVDYIYAIYRGVMNLCSEWTPTAVYKPLG